MKKAKRFNVGGPMATAPNGPVSLVKNGLGGLPSSSLPPPSKNIQQGDAFPQGSGPRPTGPALGGVGPRPTGPESPTDMTKINALKAQLKGQNSSDTGSMSPRRVAASLLSGTRGALKQPPIPVPPRPPTPVPPRPPTPVPPRQPTSEPQPKQDVGIGKFMQDQVNKPRATPQPATASPSSRVPPVQPRSPTPVPPSLQPQPANKIPSKPMANYNKTAPQVAAEYKKGGAVKTSKRGDGIAQRGKTKGRMV